MQFVPIILKTPLPFRVQVIRFSLVSLHWHDSLEVLMCTKGRVALQNGSNEGYLEKGDIFVNNMYEPHAVTAEGESELLAVQFPYTSLRAVDPEELIRPLLREGFHPKLVCLADQAAQCRKAAGDRGTLCHVADASEIRKENFDRNTDLIINTEKIPSEELFSLFEAVVDCYEHVAGISVAQHPGKSYRLPAAHNLERFFGRLGRICRKSGSCLVSADEQRLHMLDRDAEVNLYLNDTGIHLLTLTKLAPS